MSSACLMAMMLCMADAAPATPVAFEFRDSVKYEDRQVLQYRALEFRDSPVRPLGDERKFEAGTQYGVVPVGPKPETALTIVWLPTAPGGPELWLDANGDGRLGDDERHVMTGRDLETAAAIAVQPGEGPKKVDRTLLFRRSAAGDGLRYAVRGYMQGRLNLGGKEYAALLIDGNANGCFDGVGRDRVWIDLSEDGRFDPLAEQFPLGKPIPHNGEVYVVRSDALASAVVANQRSAGQGKLRLAVAQKLSMPGKISAELISDFGELVNIDKLDEAVPVPMSEYRISSLRLDVVDSDKKLWTYSFYHERTKNYAVPRDGETTVALFGQLNMNVSLGSGQDKILPGKTVTVQPKLVADESLYLSSCTVGKEGDRTPARAEGNAEVLLLSPDGNVVTRGLTGFS
jgi:hypothetical protein